MKRIVLLFFISPSLALMYCRSQKTVYEFPENMSDPVRAEFRKICEKGRVLYEMNCARCHNKTISGREVVPDFRPEDLKGYEIRISNRQHEENMPEEMVTAEELSLISTFLMYKRKRGVPMR